MKAVGFTEFGGPEVLRVLELPEPHAGPGQVRIRVRAAAVNPSDTASRSGLAKELLLKAQPDREYPPPPYVVGWDAAGVVDEVGPGTQRAPALGEHVMAITEPTGVGGADVEYLVVPAESVVPVPAGLDDVAASTLPMNALTARRALDLLALPPGATLAVTGAAGAFGGYTVQLAHAEGLRVIADASPADEELVRSLGGDVVVRRGPDVASRIREVAPEGVDGLADGAVLDSAVAGAVRDGGSVATLRFHTGPTDRGLTWHPVAVWEYLREHGKLDELRKQAEAGALTARVADTYPVERAAEAHRRMEAGGVRGRLVLTF